jgi:glyoxylase-like metal-dependent hydrolase (beta-lactamase superfamily II)
MLKIADHWFERRAMGGGVTLLWEPHVHPFLRCNIWHVRGRDADMLVDTGLGVASLKEAARDLFDKPLLAVASHTHMDHTGGIHEFETRLVHEAEAQRMAEGSGGWPLDVSGWGEAALKHWADIGYDLSGGLLSAIPHRGYDAGAHGLQAAAPTRVLREGDVVDTGDRAFEVLHLPGHSPGSIGLWEAKSGTLFSGDAIYDGPLLDEIEGADIPIYVRTMERLRELPVYVVHAGHDPSFGRARLVELCDAYLTRRR